MDIMNFFQEDIIIPQMEAKNRQEVIVEMGNLLFKKGYVKETFADAIMEREKRFPTGLYMNGINVAIPHTDAEHVIRSVIAIGSLAAPVDFCDMADPESKVKVDIVFVIAINESHSQPKLLQKLISILQDNGLLVSIKNSSSASTIVAHIKKKVS